MPTACCVLGCKSRVNQQGIQFYQLPLNKPNILTQWLIVLDRRDWIPKSSSRICSQHFLEEDLILRPNTTVPRLKPDAIPSVFPDLNSSDEKDVSDDSSRNEPEVVHVSEQVKPNKTKLPVAAPKTPVVSESPSQRPRRVSKINPKMKDYILLDDIKKHRQTPGKPQATEKDKAARELLSILEDSNSLSEEESLQVKGASTNKISAELKGNAVGEHFSGKISSQKSGLLSVSNSTPLPEKLSHKKNFNSGTLIQKDTELSSDEEVSLVPIAKRRKVATKSTSGGIPENKDSTKPLNDSIKLSSKSQEKEESGVAEIQISDKEAKSKGTPESSTKEPVSENSVAFRKTYFQIKIGETVYYFSHADLNPTVNMLKNNALYNPSTNKFCLSLEEAQAKATPVDKKSTATQSESISNESEDETFLPDEDIYNGNVSSDTDSLQLKKRSPKRPNKKNEEQNGMLNVPKGKRGRPKKLPLSINNITETSSVTTDKITPIIVNENEAPPTKKKKRFTTVAEIVVRTDNTPDGTSVSIDTINSLVNLENNLSPAKKIKKSAKKSSDGSNRTITPNVSIVGKTTNDKEMADRITDTIKKMKLLEQVKGTTDARLTVLITTLPPVVDKEILTIKKKNTMTNEENSRELEVAFSTWSENSSADGFNIPILGAFVKDSNDGKEPGSSSKNNQGDNLSSDQVSTTVSSSDPQLDTIPQEGLESRTEQILNKSDIAVLDRSIDSSFVKENDGEGDKPRDHDYISPTKADATAVNEPGEKSREIFSRLKLTEADINYRSRVFKKFKSFKESIKRKNDAILKLKEKLKYYERMVRNENKLTKKPIKLKKSTTDKIYDHIIENADISKSIDYSLNPSDLPTEFEEAVEESEEDERTCTSPITYLCEPAIETCDKPPTEQ